MKLLVLKPKQGKDREHIEVEVDEDMYPYLSRFQWRLIYGGTRPKIVATIFSSKNRGEIHIELGRTVLGLPEGNNVETLDNSYNYCRNNLYQPSWGREAGRRLSRNCDGTYG